MKIQGNKLEAGMTIKVRNIDYYTADYQYKPEGIDYCIEHNKVLKNSPVYKIKSISEVKDNFTYKARHKRVIIQHIEIELEGVNGIGKISPKNKIEVI